MNHLPRGYPYFHMMEVIGTEGRIQAIDPEQSPMTVAHATGMTQRQNFPVLLHVDEAYVREIRAFAEAVGTILIGPERPRSPRRNRTLGRYRCSPTNVENRSVYPCRKESTSMVDKGNWTLLGDDELARQLTDAAGYVRVPWRTISTAPDDIDRRRRDRQSHAGRKRPLGVVAALTDSASSKKLPGQHARAKPARSTGSSAPTGWNAARVPMRCGMKRSCPCLPTRSISSRAQPNRSWFAVRLLATDDAWFVTLRLADETLLTLEAMAARPAASSVHRC
ncbi:MAG: hypothetical protein R2849_21340 [Thermomicrobiales bacterium]